MRAILAEGERGEGRREKGEGRREKGEGRREKPSAISMHAIFRCKQQSVI